MYTRAPGFATRDKSAVQAPVFIDTNLLPNVFCRALTAGVRPRRALTTVRQPQDQRKSHETYLSAKPPQACPYPRLPGPHENPRWPRGDQSPSRQGPSATDASLTARSRSFRPTDRLKQAADFDAVFSRGTRASDRYFTFIALPNHLETARLGVAVSKKALRLAAERNRVRRLIRETYRLSVARDFPLDLVVMVKNTARDVPSPVLTAALNQRWLTIPGFHHRLTRELNEASP